MFSNIIAKKKRKQKKGTLSNLSSKNLDNKKTIAIENIDDLVDNLLTKFKSVPSVKYEYPKNILIIRQKLSTKKLLSITISFLLLFAVIASASSLVELNNIQTNSPNNTIEDTSFDNSTSQSNESYNVSFGNETIINNLTSITEYNESTPSLDIDEVNESFNDTVVFSGLNLTLCVDKQFYFENESVLISGIVLYNNTLINETVEISIIGNDFYSSQSLNVSEGEFKYIFVPNIVDNYLVQALISYMNETIQKEIRFDVFEKTMENVSLNVSNLYIWDDTDYQKKYVGEQVTFYANYSSNNQSIDNASIKIYFNVEGWTQPMIMTYNSGYYIYNSSFDIAGTYEFRVQCSSSGFDNKTIVSEFIISEIVGNDSVISIIDTKEHEQVYALPGTSFYVERTISGTQGLETFFAPIFSDGLTIEKFEIIKKNSVAGESILIEKDISPRIFSAGKGASVVERRIDILCENLPINLKQLNHVSYSRLFSLDGSVIVRVWFRAPNWEDIKSGAVPSSGHISYLTFTDNSYDFEGSTWWNSNWGKRKLITINSSQVDTDLTNFPILVYKSSDSDLASYAQSDGDDIAFVLYNDNTTKLNHEIENYTSSGQIVAWVNVTSLSSNSDTKIWMYYNNSACNSQENIIGTWNSDFKGVWHLSNNNFSDSTINNKDGTNQGTTNNDTGKIAGARDFDGGTGYINVSDPLDGNNMTFSAWIYPTEAIDNWDTIAQRDNSVGNWYDWQLYARASDAPLSNTPVFRIDVDELININEQAGGDIVLSINTWYFITATFDATDLKLYRDGTLRGTDNEPGSIPDSNKDLWIGRNSIWDEPFMGTIDEIRISNTARNASWINTAYNTVNNCSSTFLSFGGGETFVIETSVDTIEPYETASQLTVNATGDSELDNVTLWYRFSSDNSTWWNASWTFRKKLTIDHNQVAGDLINFPILVNLIDSNLSSKAQSDGDDIVFTNATGIKLNHEIELFNDTTGDLVTWVNVTSLSTSTDTEIYMYYGNSVCSNQQNSTGVWDSNYLGIWHLAETPSGPGDIKDSTWVHNGTSQSMESADQVAGQVNGCLLFDGNGEYVLMPDSSDWTLSPNLDWTLEGWFNFSVLPGSGDWDSMIGTPSDPYCFEFNEDAGDTTLNWWDGSLDHESSGQSSITTNEFHYGVLVLNFGVTSGSQWYLDGTSLGTFTAENRNINPTGLTISGDSNPNYFTGNLDEIRFSNTLRSEDWITTSYNTVNNQSTFFTISNEEAWIQYTGDTNPDENSPWSWSFNFPNGIGYYEFYSIGKKSGYTNETAPSTKDASCYYNVPGTSVNLISPYIITYSPLNITATGHSGLDNITLWYRWSNDNTSWEGGISDETNNSVDTNTTDVDSSSDKGIETDFNNAQATTIDGNNMTISEENTGSTDVDEYQYVSSLDNTWLEWDTESGTSPYIDADDSYYIHEANHNNQLEGWFYFSDTSETGSGFNITFDFLCYGDDNNDGWNIYYEYTGDSTPEGSIGFICTQTGDYAWLSSSQLTSLSATQINNMRVYLVTNNGGQMDDIYIDACRMHITRPPLYNYEIDLEYNWTTADYSKTTEQICIYVDFHTGSENLNVNYRDGNSWTNLGTISSTGWNNFTATGLNSQFYTIQFIGTSESSDTSIDTWEIDCMFLRVYNNTGGPNGFNWSKWINSSNPDTLSPWSWDFDFPNSTGYYEFYSIGNKSGSSNETAPSNADAICYFNTLANNKPTQSGEVPANTTTNVDICPIQSLYVICSDPDPGDTLNATWWSNSSGSWIQFASNNTSFASGTNITQTNNNFSNYSTTYYWSVNLTDSKGGWNNETYHFTTKSIETSIDTINPYEQTISPLTIEATGDSCLDNVSLWYRYSIDNSTWWNSSFRYRKKITINSSQVVTDLINFPILINITDPNLITKAQNDGDDIAFTNETGTKLNHEIENYNNITGELYVWVNVTALSASTDTEIYMYYGNSITNSQQNPNGVWDSNFVGVWHFDESSGSAEDSTLNLLSGSFNGNLPDAKSSQIYRGQDFDGVNDYIEVTDPGAGSVLDFANGDNITISVWIKPTALPSYGCILVKDPYEDMNYGLQNVGQQFNIFYRNSADTAFHEYLTTGNVLSIGTWSYATATYTFGTGSTAKLFIDSIEKQANWNMSDGNDPPLVGNNPLWFGADDNLPSGSPDEEFNGIIDEVRISNIIRNNSWITTSYNTMKNHSTFITLNNEESWIQWNNESNPDKNSPWSWSFDFPNGNGFYEFYSLGNKSSSSNETAPDSADTSCYFIFNNEPTQTYQLIWDNFSAFLLNNTDIRLNPISINVTITDFDGNNMNITILTNESGIWNIINQSSSFGLSNGTYSFTNTSWIDSYNKKYYVSFNLTDGMKWTNATFNFTTVTRPPDGESFIKNSTSGNNFGIQSWNETNSTYFWKYIHYYADIAVEESGDNSTWYRNDTTLKITRNKNSDEEKEKETYNFTASKYAYYRIVMYFRNPLLNYWDNSSFYEYSLLCKANATENYSIYFNWSDYVISDEATITTCKYGVMTKNGSNYFYWIVTINDPLNIDESFQIDPIFGDENEGTSGDNLENTIRGSKFLMPENGNANSISAYLYYRTAGAKVYSIKAAIYNNNSVFLGTTEERYLSSTPGVATWETFTFSSSPFLTENENYYLVIWADSPEGLNTMELRYSIGINNNNYSSQSYGAWPNSVSFLDESGSFQYNIYCTYTPNNLSVISFPGPANESIGIGPRPVCNVTVYDQDGGTVDVYFYENTTGDDIWILQQTNSSVDVTSSVSIQWDNYTNATVESTIYWWRVVVIDENGGTVEEYYHFTTVGISVTINPDTWHQGILTIGSSNETTGFYFELTNSGSTAIDIQIKATNATNSTTGAEWRLNETVELDNYSLQYNLSDIGTVWTNINLTYDTFVNNIGSSSSQTFDLKLILATLSSKSDPLEITLTFRSVLS